jgi:hypothetical protein
MWCATLPATGANTLSLKQPMLAAKFFVCFQAEMVWLCNVRTVSPKIAVVPAAAALAASSNGQERSKLKQMDLKLSNYYCSVPAGCLKTFEDTTTRR